MLQRTEIDGQGAWVAYLKNDWTPVDQGDEDFIKVRFDDGRVVFAYPSKAEVADFDPDEPRDPAGRWTALQGSQGHYALISTRPVTAVGRSEEERTAAAAQRNIYKTIDLKAMKADPEKFKANVDLLRDSRFYPGLRASETQKKVKTDDLASAAVERMKSNLEFLVRQQTPEFVAVNKRWYDGAHKLAARMAKDSGIDIASASGVIAALSPQTDWDRNVYEAKAVADSMTHRMDYEWDADMERVGKEIWTGDNAAYLPALRQTKTLRELLKGADPDAAHALAGMWIRTYDQAHSSRAYHRITAEGDEGELVKTKTTGKDDPMKWGTVSFIANAVAAYLSKGDANKLSDAMGARHKVRSFYNNILDPDSPNGDVTIDTHAVGAAWLTPSTGSDVPVVHALASTLMKKDQPVGYKGAAASSVTGVKGTYGLYAQAYREAAKDLGLKPRELQSVVWVAKREMFAEDQTGAVMKRNVDQVWRRFHDGELDLETAQREVMRVAAETKAR